MSFRLPGEPLASAHSPGTGAPDIFDSQSLVLGCRTTRAGMAASWHASGQTCTAWLLACGDTEDEGRKEIVGTGWDAPLNSDPERTRSTWE